MIGISGSLSRAYRPMEQLTQFRGLKVMYSCCPLAEMINPARHMTNNRHFDGNIVVCLKNLKITVRHN